MEETRLRWAGDSTGELLVIRVGGGGENDLKVPTGWNMGIGDRIERGIGMLCYEDSWADGDGTHQVENWTWFVLVR